MIAEVKDGLNFLSKLSLRKVLNYFQLVRSFTRSKRQGLNQHKGMPFSLAVEPTTSCNLRCPECPSGLRSFTRPTGMLNQSLYQKLIDELKDTLTYLTLYFQGEPYLHVDFFDLVKYASQKKIYTSTSTNGHYLNDENARKTVESGLDRLIISIDGTTQETYESYRVGGKLTKVLEGAQNIVRWKKKLKSSRPFVVFQFLVVRPNEHQIGQVKELAKELGVDKVLYKTAQIYDYENGSDLIPTINKYARYAQGRNGKYTIKNTLENNCWKMWHSCVLTWDGKIVPCCFDKDANYILGDINQQSFTEAWQGIRYKNFRKTLIKGRDQIEICKNCSEGTKVWA
jgi:radical SAM protein with 4Fe4S-binding SPASM domain